MLSLRKQPSFFARGPGGVSREGPSCQTPLGPGAKKDGCFRRPRHARWVWSTLIPGLFPAPLFSKGKKPWEQGWSQGGVKSYFSETHAVEPKYPRRDKPSKISWESTKHGPLVHGPPSWTRSMDPLIMDRVRGPYIFTS